VEVANAGLSRLVTSFTASAAVHLGRQSNRIDLGVLLRALGASAVGLQVAAGIALLGACLAYLATLPRGYRRIDNPPVLGLVVSVTLLCTYHQYYDMLLVGAGVVPVILIVDRSWRMLPCFGLAVVGATLAAYDFRNVTTPLCLIGVAVASAVAARMATRRDVAAEFPTLILAG
jgi:hypothetical protein